MLFSLYEINVVDFAHCLCCNRYIMKNDTKNKEVFVGLSGGVDSSVATALLKQQGHDVTGVFIKIWDERWGNCNWPAERREAMKAAMQLGIPFKTLDLSAEYKKEVADYMVREYKLGRTPNPDVTCNKTIKFGEFLRWALKQGADYIATGHYAIISNDEFLISNQISNPKSITPKKFKTINHKSKIKLLQGVDATKDQSYFLWQLTQSQLKHCLLPIGQYKKSEVRALARKFGLPNAEKPDSQGICFVGKIGLKEFLKKYLKPKRGQTLNVKGEVIGYHDGAFFLTLGQRHGFVITKKTTQDKPYYVVGKDVRKNTIVVNQRKVQEIASPAARNDIKIYKVNWIGGEPVVGKKYQARLRHLQKLESCKVKKLKVGVYEIKFGKLPPAAAPGQSLVIYDNDICLGGGIIKNSQ